MIQPVAESIELDEFTKLWAESILCFFYSTSKRKLLSYTPTELLKLMKYELHSRKREHVLDRLCARYWKLKRKLDWAAIQQNLRG